MTFLILSSRLISILPPLLKVHPSWYCCQERSPDRGFRGKAPCQSLRLRTDKVKYISTITLNPPPCAPPPPQCKPHPPFWQPNLILLHFSRFLHHQLSDRYTLSRTTGKPRSDHCLSGGWPSKVWCLVSILTRLMYGRQRVNSSFFVGGGGGGGVGSSGWKNV